MRIFGQFARLDYQAGRYSRHGLCQLFLIVWDFIVYARGHGVEVRPRRSSAAGDIAYLLGDHEY